MMLKLSKHSFFCLVFNLLSRAEWNCLYIFEEHAWRWRGGGSPELGVHHSPQVDLWSEQVTAALELSNGCCYSAWISSLHLIPTSTECGNSFFKTHLQSPMRCFPDSLGSIHPHLLCAPFVLGPDVHTALVILYHDFLTIFLLYQIINSLSLRPLGIPSTKRCAYHTLRITTT